MQKSTKRNLLALFVCLVFGSATMFAATAKIADKEANQTLRQTTGLFDQQSNTVSNIEFDITNYGIWGLNIRRNEASGRWPRGSANNYIFGGGIWFAAKKTKPGTDEVKNYVEVTYNPNSGRSWMVPGRISDGDRASNDPANLTKYRTYFSIDFNPATGEALESGDGQAWPIWDASADPNAQLKTDRYYGYYIDDVAQRSTSVFPKGPAFISGEDIFCTYKDTDLSYYEGGETQRKTEGYPLRLQFDQMVYSWGYGRYKDFIFMMYNITNSSADTLHKCWMAPVLDVDIAIATAASAGAANDFVSYHHEDSTLNLAYQWTGTSQGEKGKGFGYLGYDFLESPTVFQKKDTVEIDTFNVYVKIDTTYDDLGNPIYTKTEIKKDTTISVIRFLQDPENGFVRKDKPFYPTSEQLGLVTFKNWAIDVDPKADDERYLFMSEGVKDKSDKEGDKRFMMATGPFSMRPKDTVRIVVGVALAPGSKGTDCDGSLEDLAAMVDLDKFMQAVYDSNFRAPAPPDRTVFTKWTPLNNAVKIEWNGMAEMSEDDYEKGLDFMGYTLYRARETNSDSKPVYTWKPIKSWSISTPFVKSVRKPAGESNNLLMTALDSLRLIGPLTDNSGNILDSMAIRVMRIGNGMILFDNLRSMNYTGSSVFPSRIRNKYYPIIQYIDTSYYSRPWGNYYSTVTDPEPKFVKTGGGDVPVRFYTENTKDKLFTDVLVGTVNLNRALLKYNPIFYTRKTVQVDSKERIPEDGLIYKVINNVVTTTVDSVYFLDTYKQADINGATVGVIDVLVPIAAKDMLTDTIQVQTAMDTVYSYIQRRHAVVKFPDFEQSLEAREKVIMPYMKEITDNYTFVDIGDDNGDNKVTLNEDVLKTEKLINNMPYYYKMLAFDEGDYQQPTPHKENDASVGLPNLIETYPREGRVSEKPTFEIISKDVDKLGALYNFKFYALDNERVNSLFGGHEFELEFTPFWYGYNIAIGGGTLKTQFGLYTRKMKITDLTTGNIVFDGQTQLETSPCDNSFRELFTERGSSYVWADSVVTDSITGAKFTFGAYDSDESVVRTGRFSSGDYQTAGYCYAPYWSNEAAGTMAFDFDFSIKQFGGAYRPDSTTLSIAKTGTTTAVTPVNALFAESEVDKTTPLGRNPKYLTTDFGSFNNGPGEYKVEFMPGGEETVTLAYGKNGTEEATFTLKYLNLKVTNDIKHTRPAVEGEDDAAVTVTYPGEMSHVALNPFESEYGFKNPITNTFDYISSVLPDPRALYVEGKSTDEFIGKYNIHAFGWVNGRGNYNRLTITNQVARSLDTVIRNSKTPYTGLQGRYYYSAESVAINPKTNKKDSIDFTHIMNIAGVQFVLDYANKGRRYEQTAEWGFVDPKEYVFGDDFKVGDVITLKTTGGALGLPMPGAKVRFKVNKTDQDNRKITDNILDKVNIIPNPYYISHIGQKSPYDAKIYFTKLPKQAKIEIYTITGDLIATLNHNESSLETDKESVEVWDLLSKNGQRVASQTMAAVITTPDGAQTIKNFTVVVGGFRIIED